VFNHRRDLFTDLQLVFVAVHRYSYGEIAVSDLA